MNAASVHSTSYRASIGRDMIAGLVVFLVAVPLCLGIAHASGAPIIAGIISGIVGGVVVGLLSGSHVSVTGPAAGLTAIVLAQVQELGSFEAFLLAVAISGVLQIGLGALRAGVLANYAPNNVIKGLLAAIGVILILKQAPHLVGHDADYVGDTTFAQEDGENTFTGILIGIQRFLPGAAVIGLGCTALLLAWDRSRLKKSLFPAPLAAVLLGVVVNEILRASGSSWAIDATHLVAVPVIGSGEGQGWGDVFRTPDFSQISNPKIYTAAITLTIVASIETLLNLEATDKLDPLKRSSPTNRELVAQGVGNTISGMIGGLPMTSVIIRSSVNANAGARTRVSTVFHGVLLAVCVFLFPTLLNRIPLSALAAILIVTGFKLASPALFRQMWREGRGQFVPFAVTVVAIVLTDLLVGVIIGLVVSVLFLLDANLRRGVRMFREVHAGGVVHRIELPSQASFLNRAALIAELNKFQEGDHVVIDARTCDYVDPDILGAIREFRDEGGPARGIHVSLEGFQDRYALSDQVQYVDVSTREVQAKLTPACVLQVLKEGNERFQSGRRMHRDLARQVDATSDGQHPIAVVLGCIDSRAPVEMVFDMGIGDLFACRLAGNVPSRKALGSMEFACKVAGARLIFVLGHTRCGAVKAACDFVHTDVEKATGLSNLPHVIEPLKEAVIAETATRDDRTSKNEEFVDRVAAINVTNVMRAIREGSPVLREMIDRGEIGLAGGMYDVKTGRVEFIAAPEPGSSAKATPVAAAG